MNVLTIYLPQRKLPVASNLYIVKTAVGCIVVPWYTVYMGVFHRSANPITSNKGKNIENLVTKEAGGRKCKATPNTIQYNTITN